MSTPTQLRIIHLIALNGGKSTEAQIVALTGQNHNTINTHLCRMQRAGLVNKGKAAVWLTMKGWDENDKVSYEQT
jgi:DNA-binding IclR family transcriptional regulator